ncbi:MAG: hypothetical protein R2861_12480 [Desulfobacterales bacterium]
MKSDSAKKGIERAPHRSLMKGIGYTDEEIRRLPDRCCQFRQYGHSRPSVHPDKSPKRSKPAFTWPGKPVEFGTIGVCDGIAMNHVGMKYSLGEPGADRGFR